MNHLVQVKVRGYRGRQSTRRVRSGKGDSGSRHIGSAYSRFQDS
jgi:hypothetical protein